MLTCAEFDDRLYDEDCRRAVTAGTLVPGDMQQHMTRCGRCRAEFEAAAADCLELPGLLQLEPSRSLEAALVRLAEGGVPPVRRSLVEWRHIGNRAVVAGALAAAVVAGLSDASASPPWQLAVFVLTGSIAAGLQASVTRRTRQRSALGPWSLFVS